MFDVAIIGAGIAGLTCAQQLRHAGYRVVVLDKSLGVGGRVATRRVNQMRVDHGLPYLEPQGERIRELIRVLRSRHILELWDTVGSSYATIPQYVAPAGMSAIAKFLASHLEIKLDHRVQAITPTTDGTWQISCFDLPQIVTAHAVAIAIPAPQALMVLESLSENVLPRTFLDRLRSVQFDPCLTVLAGYPSSVPLNLSWKQVTFPPNSDLAWIGLDSSKRAHSPAPVFVLHSSAEFAKAYVEAKDLDPIGQHLLSRAAIELMLPWLDVPEWFQVHRWRYAFPSHPLAEVCLDARTPQPLVCCGDWCGGKSVESALSSGMAAANQINQYLKPLPLADINFLDNLEPS